MTKKHYYNLKVGDYVILNGLCRMDVGRMCQVTCISNCDDSINIVPIDGGLLNSKRSMGTVHSISYRAADICYQYKPIFAT